MQFRELESSLVHALLLHIDYILGPAQVLLDVGHGEGGELLKSDYLYLVGRRGLLKLLRDVEEDLA